MKIPSIVKSTFQAIWLKVKKKKGVKHNKLGASWYQQNTLNSLLFTMGLLVFPCFFPEKDRSNHIHMGPYMAHEKFPQSYSLEIQVP